MFAATLTLTIGGDAKVLTRVNQDSYGSEYQFTGADDGITMKIRHSKDSVDGDGIVMKRHNVYVERVIYPSPTVTMKKETFTFTMRGGQYEDPTLQSDLAKAAIVWLSASSSAAIVDLSVGAN